MYYSKENNNDNLYINEAEILEKYGLHLLYKEEFRLIQRSNNEKMSMEYNYNVNTPENEADNKNNDNENEDKKDEDVEMDVESENPSLNEKGLFIYTFHFG